VVASGPGGLGLGQVLQKLSSVGVGGEERLDGELGQGDVVRAAEAGDGAVQQQVPGRVGQLQGQQQFGGDGFVVVVQGGRDVGVGADFGEQVGESGVAGESG